MLSLVNYCEERYSKFDIRFKDLNNKELEDCKRLLEYVLDESNYKSILVDCNKDTNINYGDIYYKNSKIHLLTIVSFLCHQQNKYH